MIWIKLLISFRIAGIVITHKQDNSCCIIPASDSMIINYNTCELLSLWSSTAILCILNWCSLDLLRVIDILCLFIISWPQTSAAGQTLHSYFQLFLWTILTLLSKHFRQCGFYKASNEVDAFDMYSLCPWTDYYNSLNWSRSICCFIGNFIWHLDENYYTTILYYTILYYQPKHDLDKYFTYKDCCNLIASYRKIKKVLCTLT